MKKLLIFILIPLASAEECSILNLGTCISQNFFNFLLNILTSPLQLILDLIYTLLVKPINIEIFSQPLAVIIYILSMFYGVLIMYSGFRFMLSGYSAHQREGAKQSLTNTILLITFVQASYFIYSLAIQITSAVTAALMNLTSPNLFKLTADNLLDFNLQLALAAPYLLTIITTLIILTIRFIVVSIGVLIFPVAIFFYFIEPLKSYGRALMNLIFSIMSITFFYAIFFIACSTLLDVDVTLNTLIMIATFAIVNLITILITIFVVIKAAMRSPKINVIQKI